MSSDEDPSEHGQRPRTKVIVRAAVGAALVIASVLGAVQFTRWRADRAYVGTDAAATFRWGQCLNAIHWRDPATGIDWWAGDSIVTTGQWESERVRATWVPSRDPGAAPVRSIVHSSVGTMHFDAYDRATFTSRTGGTLQFVRPPPDIAYQEFCATGRKVDVTARKPPAAVWGQLEGVLGHRAPSGTDIELERGTIHISVDGTEVDAIPVSGDDLLSIGVVTGTLTIRAEGEHGDCGTVTVAVAGGERVTHEFICEE